LRLYFICAAERAKAKTARGPSGGAEKASIAARITTYKAKKLRYFFQNDECIRHFVIFFKNKLQRAYRLCALLFDFYRCWSPAMGGVPAHDACRRRSSRCADE
jgi:hypothetical protein